MDDLYIKNPTIENKIRKMIVVDHFLSDGYKEYSIFYLKKQIGMELYEILEQATNPCVVSLKEDVINKGEKDTIIITLTISPVKKQHVYLQPAFSGLSYKKINKEKESKWKEIWKLLHH